MTRQEINEKLNSVFQEVFNNNDLTVTDATIASDVDGWDSIAHLTLMSSVEDAFSIEFSLGEINGFNNVGQLISAIENHLS